MKFRLFRCLVPVLLFVFPATSQTLQSPEAFLGYPVGSQFTYHHRISDYVHYVAETLPARTRLIPYGKTNEGRPLQVIAVGSEEHIKNLDTYRLSHLKSIGLTNENSTTPPDSPVIAWLSYNVHGDEAVSSEAVMVVLHELLNPANAVSREILKNTIVILDPCINPDGRDRYTNWYSRYMGVTPDVNAASIEHHQPWPGGRFNHYLFDLNRDWAWQVQVESQQRMRLYHEWMPHLHADFHEMGANSTYYFPPSARPYHEDLTPWQRKFQTTLGEYNKKRFDQAGWLYFTKESFDLLYPSYGDTYPSYNGAIGMTFEQGGSGRAGVRFLREDGDTLTLADRIAHHVATSFGTLEAVSENADEVVKNFKTYFTEPAKNGLGSYKTYAMSGSRQAVSALAKTLDGMGIRYGYSDKSQKIAGYDYATRRENNVEFPENSLLVSTVQPKGRFVKILFEPATALEDSNTYDITTWALPYAYGLKAVATSQRIGNEKTAVERPVFSLPAETPYAYLVKNNAFASGQFLAHLLKNKVKVRLNEQPFTANGVNYPAGTILITKKGNEGLGQKLDGLVAEAVKKYDVDIQHVTSGMVEKGSDFGAGSVAYIKPPKVGIVMGSGVSPTAAGEVWHYFEQQLNYPATIIDTDYFKSINLWDFDVLILPDGSYSGISTDELKRWLTDGGRVIALEGANKLFLNNKDFGLKAKKMSDDPDKFKTYGNQERDYISNLIPGAIFKVKMDATHPLAYGYADGYYANIKSPDAYELLENGWNVGYLQADSYVTGFVGSNVKKTLPESLIFGVEPIGKGQAVYMIDNPLFRGFWYGGKELFANAVFLIH